MINTKDLTKHTQISVRTWDKVKDPDIILYELMKKYPKIIQQHYNLKEDDDINKLIEEVGRRKNFMIKGGKIDTDRAARQILKDFQEGKIRIQGL